MLVLVAHAAHVSCFVLAPPAVVSSSASALRTPTAALSKTPSPPQSSSHSARTGGVLALKSAQSMQGNSAGTGSALLGRCVAFVRSTVAAVACVVALMLSIHTNNLQPANASPAAPKEAAVVSQVQVADSSHAQQDVRKDPGMAVLSIASALGLAYVFVYQKKQLDKKSMRPRGPKSA
jgi:hypothetical protein